MSEFLYTIEVEKEDPTLSDIAALLNISEDLISKDFGLIPLEKGSYCILIDEKALPGLTDKTGTAFSNPTIEPFGLEEE